MHFENLLARATEGSSFPVDAFVDYSELKRLMSLIPGVDRGASSPAGGASALAAQLAATPASVSFFSRLLAEVAKVSRYYAKAESALVAEYESTLEQLRFFCAKYPPGSAASVSERRNETHALLRNMIKLSSSLIHLENYAVLCYAGFGKALKKHDKNTSERGRLRGRAHAGAPHKRSRTRPRAPCARVGVSKCHIILRNPPTLSHPSLPPRLDDADSLYASPREQPSIRHVPRRPPHSLVH